MALTLLSAEDAEAIGQELDMIKGELAKIQKSNEKFKEDIIEEVKEKLREGKK